MDGSNLGEFSGNITLIQSEIKHISKMVDEMDERLRSQEEKLELLERMLGVLTTRK